MLDGASLGAARGQGWSAQQTLTCPGTHSSTDMQESEQPESRPALDRSLASCVLTAGRQSVSEKPLSPQPGTWLCSGTQASEGRRVRQASSGTSLEAVMSAELPSVCYGRGRTLKSHPCSIYVCPPGAQRSSSQKQCGHSPCWGSRR